MAFFQKTEEDIKKEIEKKINRLIKAGKTKEAEEFTKFHEQEDLKDAFFNKLFMWGHTNDKEKRRQLFKEAANLAKNIYGLEGWPNDAKTFWDVESYGWLLRIPKDIREFIKKDLLSRIDTKKSNLSLGCGSYPYIENSVLVDFSENMLNSVPNEMAKEKVLHNLEDKTLPFKDNSFDSVNLVFVVDYIQNLKNLFKEIKRVLKKNGKLVIVQSKEPIDEFYRTQEVRHLAGMDLKKLLIGFCVTIDEKQIGNKVLVFVEAKV
jgi:hypothetical protein